MKLIGKILILFSLMFILVYFIYIKNIEKSNKELTLNYIEETSINSNLQNNEIKEGKKEEQLTPQETINYIAVIEIPKIYLKNGIIESKGNLYSINKAISLDSKSTYPSKFGNFILYAHSGNTYNSFFTNIKNLNEGDEIFIYFEGIKYIYKITNKYEIEKTGKAEVIKTNSKKIITLITCVLNANRQLVLLGEQVSIEKY